VEVTAAVHCDSELYHKKQTKKKQMSIIYVKTLTGTVYDVTNIDLENDKFEIIAQHIEEKVGIPPAKLRLMHHGKVCALETKLKDHNVKDKDTKHLVLSQR